MSEHGAEGGFPDTAFPAEDEDLVLNAAEASGDEGDIGVGPFGSGGAYFLVGTAGASGFFAGESGFRTGAVGGFGGDEGGGVFEGSGEVDLDGGFERSFDGGRHGYRLGQWKSPK